MDNGNDSNLNVYGEHVDDDDDDDDDEQCVVRQFERQMVTRVISLVDMTACPQLVTDVGETRREQKVEIKH